MAAVPGIYAIRNKLTGKCYIGSSTNIEARFRQHKYLLNKGVHSNTHLLNAWRKNGSGCFSFEVKEQVKGEGGLVRREQYWIDKLGHYNIIKKAERAFNYRKVKRRYACRKGVNNPFYGRKHSAATKRKMKEYQRNKVVAAATKRRLARLQTGAGNSGAVLTESIVRRIRAKFKARKGKSSTCISLMAELYKVRPSTIQKVVYRQNWRHVR